MRSSGRCLATVLLLAVLAPALPAQTSNADQLYASARALEASLRHDMRERGAGAAAMPLLRRARTLVGTYQDLARLFPRSGYSDNALWQGASLAADAFWEFGDAAERTTALRLFNALVTRYPSSALTARAAEPVARLSAATAASTAVAREAATAPSAVSTLTGIRREVLPDSLRVTLELEREATFHDERLGGPPRVFLDLWNTRTVDALKDVTLIYGDDVVRQIRVGRQLGGRTRVVLDLTGAARHSVYTLYNPYRVVIDIERHGTEKPEKTGKVAKTLAATKEANAKSATALDDAVQASATRDHMAARGSVSAANVVLATRTRSVVTAFPHRVTAGRVSATVLLPSRPAVPTSLRASAMAGPARVSPANESALVPASVDAAVLPGDSTLAPAPPSTNRRGGFSFSRQLGLGIARIVIDPGHGGHDPGAQANGLDEAGLVLDVALRLEALLLRQSGVEVVMTRRANQYVSLEERTAIANRGDADLFLSIHANASDDVRARGVETYFLNFAPNPQAEAIAARENAAAARTMRNLPDIVKAIALNNKIDESRDLATLVQASMTARLVKTNKNLRSLGVRQAPFIVLVGATMPSSLTEISFMTNGHEAALLRTQSYRQQIAEALLSGVMRYQKSLKAGTIAKQ